MKLSIIFCLALTTGTLHTFVQSEEHVPLEAKLLTIEVPQHPTTQEVKEALLFLYPSPAKDQDKALASYKLLLNYFTHHAPDMEYVYMRATLIEILTHFKSLQKEYMQSRPLQYGLLTGFLWAIFYFNTEQLRPVNQARIFGDIVIFGSGLACSIQFMIHFAECAAYHEHQVERVIPRLENLLTLSEHQLGKATLA